MRRKFRLTRRKGRRQGGKTKKPEPEGIARAAPTACSTKNTTAEEYNAADDVVVVATPIVMEVESPPAVGSLTSTPPMICASQKAGPSIATASPPAKKSRKIHTSQIPGPSSRLTPPPPCDDILVTWALNARIGCDQLNKFLADFNAPTIDDHDFKRHERIVGTEIEKTAKDSCPNAATLERELVLSDADTRINLKNKLCREIESENSLSTIQKEPNQDAENGIEDCMSKIREETSEDAENEIGDYNSKIKEETSEDAENEIEDCISKIKEETNEDAENEIEDCRSKIKEETNEDAENEIVDCRSKIKEEIIENDVTENKIEIEEYILNIKSEPVEFPENTIDEIQSHEESISSLETSLTDLQAKNYELLQENIMLKEQIETLTKINSDFATGSQISSFKHDINPLDERCDVVFGLVGGSVGRDEVDRSSDSSQSISGFKTHPRMDPSKHLPIRSTSRRCALCSTAKEPHRTRWSCIKCKVGLCLSLEKNCFLEFHETVL